MNKITMMRDDRTTSDIYWAALPLPSLVENHIVNQKKERMFQATNISIYINLQQCRQFSLAAQQGKDVAMANRLAIPKLGKFIAGTDITYEAFRCCSG